MVTFEGGDVGRVRARQGGGVGLQVEGGKSWLSICLPEYEPPRLRLARDRGQHGDLGSISRSKQINCSFQFHLNKTQGK